MESADILQENRFEKFLPLMKVEEVGHRIYGISCSEAVDSDNEISDYGATKAAYEKWSESALAKTTGAGQEPSYGNIRIQHDVKTIGGKATKVIFKDSDKETWLETEPVNDDVWKMLKGGFLTGYSQSGNYAWRKCKDCGTDLPKKTGANFCPHCKCVVTARYGMSQLAEVSYVDNGANPDASFTFVRADGSTELRKFAKHEEPQAVADEEHKLVEEHIDEASPKLKEHVREESNQEDGHEKAAVIPKPDANKSFRELIALVKSGDIEASNEEIPQLLEALEKTMATEEKDLVKFDKAARHSIHQKIAALKAAATSHLEACKSHHAAMHAGLDGVAKVMGGGVESMGEEGHPEEVTHPNPDVVRQVPGASDTAAKSIKYVSIGKDAAGVELFKAVDPNAPPPTAEEIGKAVLKAFLDVQKASVAEIGDRTKTVPFRKAATKEDDGAAGGGNDTKEEMSKEDWAAYAQGDRESIAKAQRITAQKWQPVPSRMMNRAAAGTGSLR